jgi:carbamoyltransferase
MTLCFRAKAAMRDRFPAAVHVDGTARAQLVRRETNPAFHALLTAWKAASGAPLLLNTSFNIHEEPIVNTPEEALRTFLAARLDALALEDCLVGDTARAAAPAEAAAVAGGSPP